MVNKCPNEDEIIGKLKKNDNILDVCKETRKLIVITYSNTVSYEQMPNYENWTITHIKFGNNKNIVELYYQS